MHNTLPLEVLQKKKRKGENAHKNKKLAKKKIHHIRTKNITRYRRYVEL